MDPQGAPIRIVAFLAGLVVVVVVALALMWSFGEKRADDALARTPPIDPRLSPQPIELERYHARPPVQPPAEPLAATDQQASPPPAEPLAQTQQPTPQVPQSDPLAQAQNPMQGQPLQGQAHTPLTEEVFVQIAAEIAVTPSGQSAMPQDMMGLAIPAARIFEKYHVDIMEYYQKSQEWLQGPRQDEFQRRINARIAQLRQLQATPRPQPPARMPYTTPTPRKKGR